MEKKKILITAKNSYIGNSFAKWTVDKYDVDFISCRTAQWKESDFSPYDVVFHVAGIAHIKEKKENKDLYTKVNTDLTVELAKKAKESLVKQFIFVSTMSVYGIERGLIRKGTPTNPKTNYGISKLKAEELIKPMEDENFKIAIVRPPMVYGQNCKGNYQRLVKFALKSPVFPRINNQRSMIYIDNLSEFISCLIDGSNSGVFFPQNADYVNTSNMVELIRRFHGKKMITTKLFNPFLNLMVKKVAVVDKVFGDLMYDKSMMKYKNKYCIYDLEESIKKTEGFVGDL